MTQKFTKLQIDLLCITFIKFLWPFATFGPVFRFEDMANHRSNNFMDG